MPAYKVIATFYDPATGGYVRPGGAIPAQMLDMPAELARLEEAGCIAPAPAGDTPALARPAARSRPVRGRKAR